MTEAQIKTLVVKYLPVFVVENELFDSIVSAVAKTLETLSSAIETETDWTGKGLKLNASENAILYHSDTAEEDIQDMLENRYTINSERGTEQGIIEDITRITGEEYPVVNFYDYPDTAFLMGDVFLGDNYRYLGTHKVIMTNQEISQEDKQKIIPIDTKLITDLSLSGGGGAS